MVGDCVQCVLLVTEQTTRVYLIIISCPRHNIVIFFFFFLSGWTLNLTFMWLTIDSILFFILGIYFDQVSDQPHTYG